MKLINQVCLLSGFLIISQFSYSQSGVRPPADYHAPSINLVSPNKTTLGQYEKLELTIDISAYFDNPFDPDEISVEARFKGPDDKSVTVPGFYYQEYQRTQEDNKEVLAKVMDAGWRIRFSPPLSGRYTYTVSVQDKYRIIRSEPQEFMVTASPSKGFVRVSKVSPYYFQMDNGDPYFPIGHNVCWTGPMGTYEYDKYFKKMSAAGENYTRVWMINWSLGLEYPPKVDAGFDGLGRYHLANAYKLDTILEQAEKKGIYVMLCLDSFSDLKTGGSLGQFKNSSYSSTQRGPCNSPEEFFTNEKAKQYFKKRLRYIIARYGYSTHLLAWELWNEVDLTDNYNSANVTKWHQEMARYIREIDPQQHLITTSFSNTRGDHNIWELPEISIVQSHLYGFLDTAAAIHQWCEQKTMTYAKPHIFGEFGLDAVGKTENTESTGLYLHNGIWASTMSRSAGSAMSWWWDNYIDPNNLYKVFTGLAKFTQGIPWNRPLLQYMIPSSLRFMDAPVYEKNTDAVLWLSGGWGEKSNILMYHISPDGSVQEKEPINTFLQGTSKQELTTTHKFSVDYPTNGKFLVHVNQVSKQAVLTIRVDGQVAYQHEFNPASGKGEWKEEKFNEEFGAFQNIYDQDYGIGITQGKHTIEISNEGEDWISINQITLTNYVSSDVPNLRILGLQSDSMAIFWMQNKGYDWYNLVRNQAIDPVKRTTFDISGLKTGRYKLEWYDTVNAKLLSSWNLVNHIGTVPIIVPEIQTDIAAKLYWVGE